jgi:predicted GIY-YIG superfamily endonuclease
MYTTYKIEVDNVCLYIGHTKDLKKREYQHNYSYKKEAKKALYDYLRGYGYSGYIKLIPIKEWKTKVQAKRHEMYLILRYMFMYPDNPEFQLKQKIPNISDR